MGLSIGIDLGTTNSVAGIATPEGVRLVVDGKGKTIHASVVSYPEGGGLFVGNQAKVRKATDPAHTIYSAKRLIGQNARSPLVQLAMAALPYNIEEGSNQQPIVVVDGRKMSIPEISAQVLAYLKRLGEEQFGDEVTSAVITVPANFSDAQRQATKEAGRLAGLEVQRLVNEPTAAALAYGYGQEMDQRVAVFDFGGGTFDVSILKIDADIFEVLATDGEFFLGGDDIDRIVAEYLASEMNRHKKIDPRSSVSAMNRLHIAAEQIKQYLTNNFEASGTIDGVVIDDIGKPASVDFHIDRDRFDGMIEGFVDRAIDVCRNVLTHANLKVGDINDVILVGGSTRVPLVRSRLSDFFERELASSINPDEVVAHGAAIQAAMLSGSMLSEAPEDTVSTLAEDAKPIDLGIELEPSAGEERSAPANSALLLDVTPAALRIGTAGGFTECFLEKNAPIPIERTQMFTTAHANQTRVVIQCCRGDYTRFADNEALGSLTLENIPPGDRGEAQIEVTFRVDPDCILHVRATDLRSSESVEAKLNMLGAPTDEPFSDDAPAKGDKKRDKADKKAAKERDKAEKKAAKEREKAEKKAAKEREKAEKKAAKGASAGDTH